MFSFFQLFSKKLRLSNPWKYKVPLLISWPYLLLLVAGTSVANSYIFIGLSFVTIIGIAGIGYLTNDLSDRKADKQVGKENVTSEMSGGKNFALLTLFVGLAIAPWFFFPMNQWSYWLLGGEIFMLVIYAFPPFRLKEKGWAGVVADALYAHVIPSILAVLTFYLVCNKTLVHFEWLLLLLVVWQLVLGIRNILFHQVKDYPNDIKSNTRTLVTVIGVPVAERIIKHVALPLELLSLMVFLVALSAAHVHLSIGFLGFVVLVVLQEKNKRLGYREWANKFLDEFYNAWIPVLILIFLSVHDYRLSGLLVLHFVMFRSGPLELVKRYKYVIGL